MQIIENGTPGAPRAAVSISENILTIGSVSINLLEEGCDSACHVPVFVAADGTLSRDPADRWAALVILPPLIPGAPGESEDDPPAPATVDHLALVVHTWPVPAPSDGDLE